MDITIETLDIESLAGQVPPLDAETYEALKADIMQHGIQVPVLVTPDGRVIDGAHRVRIARELGVPCPMEVVEDKSEADLGLLAISLNVNRRQLSPDTRRELVAKMSGEGKSTEEIAEALQVTPRTVKRDRKAAGVIDNARSEAIRAGLATRARRSGGDVAPVTDLKDLVAEKQEEQEEAAFLASEEPDLLMPPAHSDEEFFDAEEAEAQEAKAQPEPKAEEPDPFLTLAGMLRGVRIHAEHVRVMGTEFAALDGHEADQLLGLMGATVTTLTEAARELSKMRDADPAEAKPARRGRGKKAAAEESTE